MKKLTELVARVIFEWKEIPVLMEDIVDILIGCATSFEELDRLFEHQLNLNLYYKPTWKRLKYLFFHGTTFPLYYNMLSIPMRPYDQLMAFHHGLITMIRENLNYNEKTGIFEEVLRVTSYVRTYKKFEQNYVDITLTTSDFIAKKYLCVYYEKDDEDPCILILNKICNIKSSGYLIDPKTLEHIKINKVKHSCIYYGVHGVKHKLLGQPPSPTLDVYLQCDVAPSQNICYVLDIPFRQSSNSIPKKEKKRKLNFEKSCRKKRALKITLRKSKK